MIRNAMLEKNENIVNLIRKVPATNRASTVETLLGSTRNATLNLNAANSFEGAAAKPARAIS